MRIETTKLPRLGLLGLYRVAEKWRTFKHAMLKTHLKHTWDRNFELLSLKLILHA